jgi:hypothetical protein
MRAASQLLAVLAFTAGLVVAPPFGIAHGDEVRSCPGYRTALLEAKAALARGDRAHAISELQRAKAALRECRGEAKAPSVVAAAATRIAG